jgi:hypothetical protein
MVKMDFQTHQSIENWMENISFRHDDPRCPVIYTSFSTLKLTVKWVWLRRPPRARARQTWRAERGGSRPPESTRPLSVSRRLPVRPSQGGPANFSQADFERQLRGPDYEVTKKVEPIRTSWNPIFESYTIPRAALRSIFRILTTFLLKL